MEAYQGLAQANGILAVKEEGLLVEFEVKDSLVGVIKSGVKSVMIPYEEVISVEVKSNIFRSKMTIQVGQLGLLEGLPNTERGELKIAFRKKDKAMALDIESRIRFLASEVRLNDEERSGFWE
jgi:hypothetical protein